MMLTIEQFSKMGQVTVQALRRYDEAELLKPVLVDETTGNLYYAAEQIKQLNRIVALEDLQVAPDQIRELIRNNVSAAEILKMLETRKAELQKWRDKMMAELKQLEEFERHLKPNDGL